MYKYGQQMNYPIPEIDNPLTDTSPHPQLFSLYAFLPIALPLPPLPISYSPHTTPECPSPTLSRPYALSYSSHPHHPLFDLHYQIPPTPHHFIYLALKL